MRDFQASVEAVSVCPTSLCKTANLFSNNCSLAKASCKLNVKKCFFNVVNRRPLLADKLIQWGSENQTNHNIEWATAFRLPMVSGFKMVVRIYFKWF